MTRTYGRSAASAMVFAGAAARIFCGMGTEYSAAYNAGWLCPLIALLLCAPLALAVKHVGNLGGDSPWNNLVHACPKWLSRPISALLIALLLYDCAIIMRLTASTANFVSLNDVSLPWLTLPLVLTQLAVNLLPPDSEGFSARIWLLILPLMLLVVAAVQFKSYNPSWLTPILGGGLPAIAQGSLYCGGWLALLFLPWFTAVPDRGRNLPLRPMVFAALSAALLLVVLRMLCPSMVETNLSEIERAEIILSNNRVSHVLQMFLTLLWFGSLLHLICIESAAAVSFISNLLPAFPRWLPAGFCALATGFISLSDLVRNAVVNRFYLYLYIAIGTACALMMSFALAKSGGKSHAHP